MSTGVRSHLRQRDRDLNPADHLPIVHPVASPIFICLFIILAPRSSNQMNEACGITSRVVGARSSEDRCTCTPLTDRSLSSPQTIQIKDLSFQIDHYLARRLYKSRIFFSQLSRSSNRYLICPRCVPGTYFCTRVVELLPS